MFKRLACLAAVLAFAASSAFAQNPRGAASATVGGKKVAVDYGRPALKGRPLDALLKPLLDNGGPTKTHEPRFDSPAVGGGNPAAPGGPAPACPAIDQRGVTRPQGAKCDSGAVETTDTAAVLARHGAKPVEAARDADVLVRQTMETVTGVQDLLKRELISAEGEYRKQKVPTR